MAKTLKLSGNMVVIDNPDRGFDYQEAANVYRDFVEDLAAYVRFELENNNIDHPRLLTTLLHDIAGVDRHGLGGTFSPRVTGYSNH